MGKMYTQIRENM